MRSLWLVGVCGCSLYFGDASQPSRDATAPTVFDAAVVAVDAAPPPIDAPTEFCEWYTCQDGVVYSVDPTPVQSGVCALPTLQGAMPIETCQYGCELAGFYQGTSVAPCAPPPPPAFDCAASGACTAGATEGCGGNVACSGPLDTGTCACGSDDNWSCTPACRDTLCSSSAVQQAIVGTWSGTATPLDAYFPAPPWSVTLAFAADATWVGSTDLPYRDPFYYGGAGGGADKLYIQAETAIGAAGTLDLFGGGTAGLVEDLDLDGDHLTFTFVASWLNCSFSFGYDLTRTQ